MKKINFVFALGLALVGLSGMSSCQNDEDLKSESENSSKLRSDAADGNRMDSVVVLSFDTYKSANEVIVASDTSYIAVSDIYLNRIGKKIEKGMYVDVWHAATDAAFVVKVTGVTRTQGTVYQTYTVERASFKDVLPEGSYNLNLDPYVDEGQGFRLGDGRINSAAYYRASDNTYHPVAYKFVDQNLTGAESEKYVSLPYAGWNSPMVEDNPSNATIGGKFIDISAKTSFTIPLGDDCGSIGIDKLQTDISASMWLTLDIGMKWFLKPYVQKFEAAAGGKLDFEVDASLQMKKDIKLWNKDLPVFKFGHYVATFSILCIPVSVDCDPQIVLSSTGTVQGAFKFTTQYKCGVDLQAGVGYYDGSGWKNLSHANATQNFSSVKPVLYGQATANVGLFLKMPFMLYGCAGPNFQAGPQIKSVFTGTYDLKSNSITGNGTLDLVVGGKVGAEINVLGHEFAKWETNVDLWDYNLWKGEYSIGADDSKDAQEMVEKAKADYQEKGGAYVVNSDNFNVKQITYDSSFTYIESLIAKPTEMSKMLDGHDLEPGDYVDLYYDRLHNDQLIVTSVESYYSKYTSWFSGCNIYHFRPVGR